MKPIVVGVDDSAGARAALAWAFDRAKCLGAPLIAVTAIEPPQIVGRAPTWPELIDLDGIRAASAEWLKLLVESAQEADRAVPVTLRVVEAHPVDALVDESQGAQLVVVGARGVGRMHRLLLGSVSSGVSHHAHCSVVVVRAARTVNNEGRAHVVVGYDHSPDSETALKWATDWCRTHDAVLTIVTAWEWPTFQGAPIVFGHIDPRREIKESVEAAAIATGLPDPQLRTVVEQGSPARVLIEQSRDADLLVVGCRGVGGFAELMLGSVSKHCSTHASCSVAIVRG